MAYTPNDIYDYIIENDRESEFLQAITLHKQNFSIGEITEFKSKHSKYEVLDKLMN